MYNIHENNYRSIKKEYESKHGAIVYLRGICIACILIPLLLFGKFGDDSSVTLARIILVWIIIMGIALIVLAVIGSNTTKVIKECESVEWRLEMQRMTDKEKRLNEAFKKIGIIDRTIKDRLCIGNNKLYILDGPDMEVVRKYADKMEDDSLKKQARVKLDMHSIDLEDILFFTKEGDVQYTTSISGGGGGGSSIGGAIVGGVIAGEAGAIIGSRKKIEEIKSVENKYDSRESVIRYKKDNKILEKRYMGFEIYEFLFKYIPEKDLLNVQLIKSNSNSTDDNRENESQYNITESNDRTNNLEEKLLKLKELYDKSLIDKEEYEKKRKEIIDSI